MDKKGFVSEAVLESLKENSPIFCVDAVLIPRDGAPSAILVYRDKNNFASSEEFWFVGGRVRKGESIVNALQRKIEFEIGLESEISEEDLLFLEDGFHIRSEKDNKFHFVDRIPSNTSQKDIYHTPVALYLVRTPPFEQIIKRLKPKEGNSKYKLFTEIDPNLNFYIKKGINAAWKKTFP